MKKDKHIKSLFSLIVFGVGVLIAVLLAGTSALAEYEAALFDSGTRADRPLNTLYCPALISSTEAGKVTVSVSNPSDYEVNPVVKARISARSAIFIREEVEQVILKPGEKQTLRWPVFAEDAAYRRLVLVRVLVGPSYPLDSRTTSCGIVVVDLAGLTGTQIQLGAIFLSALLMATGWLSWTKINPVRSGRKAELGNGLRFMGMIALLGMLTTFTNWWLASLLCVIACLLLGVILLGRYGADVD